MRVCACACIYIYIYTHTHTYIYTYDVCVCAVSMYAQIRAKLIAFELAGEDRERRENPVVSRLKIAFTRCTNVVERDFSLASRILRPTQTQTALCTHFYDD